MLECSNGSSRIACHHEVINVDHYNKCIFVLVAVEDHMFGLSMSESELPQDIIEEEIPLPPCLFQAISMCMS